MFTNNERNSEIVLKNNSVVKNNNENSRRSAGDYSELDLCVLEELCGGGKIKWYRNGKVKKAKW